MKTCHTCGQSLPLKIGAMVEFLNFNNRKAQGIVVKTTSNRAWVDILDLQEGVFYTRAVQTLTRLRGYYRITEREPLG